MRKKILIGILAISLMFAVTSKPAIAAWGDIANYLKRVATNIIPTKDATYNLGSSAKKFKTIYVSDMSATNLNSTDITTTGNATIGQNLSVTGSATVNGAGQSSTNAGLIVNNAGGAATTDAFQVKTDDETALIQSCPVNNTVYMNKTTTDTTTDFVSKINYALAIPASSIKIGGWSLLNNTGAIVSSGTHGVGFLGQVTDTAVGNMTLYGVEGRADGRGKGALTFYEGVLGLGTFQGTTFGATQYAIGVEGRSEITTDGTTPLAEGVGIAFYAPAAIGGATKYSFYGEDNLKLNAVADFTELGAAKAVTTMINLTNTYNAADMDGTGTGIDFYGMYYNATTPAPMPLARIYATHAGDSTEVAASEDAWLIINTTLSGASVEAFRVGGTAASTPYIGIGTNAPSAKMTITDPGVAANNTVGQNVVLSLFDNTSDAIGEGAAIAMKGYTNAGGSATTFGVIQGAKETNTNSDCNGSVVFYTATDSGGINNVTEKGRFTSGGNLNLGGPINFGVDVAAADAYEITLMMHVDEDVPTYKKGQMFLFEANNTNTGACTLNVTVLNKTNTAVAMGAVALKINGTTSDPIDNWIDDDQIVMTVYNGTTFSIINPDANP